MTTNNEAIPAWTALDFSTIDRDVLRSLPVYELPAAYHLGTRGMGCAFDAPGFPSYFVQPVYNRYGNTPASAPDAVLDVPGESLRIITGSWQTDDSWETRQATQADLYRRLYRPLPINHPRVQRWIGTLYGYFRNCYVDLRKDPKLARNVSELIIFGVDHPDRDNTLRYIHRATLDVRDVYGEGYDPDPLPVGVYGGPHGSDWWERAAERPAIDVCPGSHGRPHTAGQWCQFCGRSDD